MESKPEDLTATPSSASGELSGDAGEPEGDAIVGVTLDTLKRAAHGVEIERQVAEAIQRSLLPHLPTVPGVRVAARYRPSSAETHVGGDWYDVIPLRGDKVGIAIGDVAGRGVEAAVRMADLRSALRAYAREGLRPAVVLERMNGFILDGERSGMVTLLYAIIDPDGYTIRGASAGHPPALVVHPDGRPTFVELRSGSPLGVNRFPSYKESVAALDPWSTVLLYTDGLVEGPDLPLGDGLEGLRQSIQGAPRDPDALCRRVLESIDARAGSRDDLALLAIQIRPPGDTLALELSARPSSLVSMRRGLAHWLRLAGAAEDEVYEVLVACGEACANAVAHAHPAIMDSLFEIRATRSGRQIEVVVSDSGQWRGSGEAPPGRGLALMRALMDEVDIDTGSRGTVVTLRRRLRDATSA